MVFQSIATPSAELEYVSDRDGGFKRSLERCKLLTRWAFEYFDQTEVCSGSSIVDPIHASAGIREFRERVLRKKSVQLYAIFFCGSQAHAHDPAGFGWMLSKND